MSEFNHNKPSGDDDDNQPLLQPIHHPKPFLDWIVRKTVLLSRNELASVVFLFTLSTTLFVVSLLKSASNLHPKGEVNYAVLTNDLEKLRVENDVKGMVVGVVKDGKLVYAQPFGEKNDKGEKVNLRTLFEIGSNTKAFTAVAISMLVEQGKIAWDTPVTDLLPGFEFNDPVANKYATLEDVMSHQTGMATHDWMLLAKNSTLSIAMNLKHLPPVYAFRETFSYSNAMWTVPGSIVSQACNEGWPSFIQTRIFERLEMYHSFTSFKESKEDPEASQGFTNGKPWTNERDLAVMYDAVGPVGSISVDILDCRIQRLKRVKSLQSGEMGLVVPN
ncbi:hypothetical protein HDU97_004765 [Phlyctochytrium planicorne]|nr:hypothetical protein HDU97_004765 [Phlyctochytrium planicorne]